MDWIKETFYNLPMFGCLDLMGLSHDGYDGNRELLREGGRLHRSGESAGVPGFDYS